MPLTVSSLALLGWAFAADHGYPWIGAIVALFALLEVWGPRRDVRKLVRQIMRRERDRFIDPPQEARGFKGMYQAWAYGRAPETRLAQEALGFDWLTPNQFDVVRRAIRRSLLTDSDAQE